MKLIKIFTGCILLTSSLLAADITVDLTKTTKDISALIYGSNQPHRTKNNAEKFAMQRMGGNRTTAYNWENNASNAGADWKFSSDNYLTLLYGIDAADENKPGMSVTTFHDQGVDAGIDYTLATIQMTGYVTADKDGSVVDGEEAPSSRWKKTKFVKGSAFTLTPDPTDDFVYMDEQVNFYVNKYGKANTSGAIRAYSLDNEPALWPHTHKYIRPEMTQCDDIVDLNKELSKAIKNVDESAEVYGPALFGMGAFLNMADGMAQYWDHIDNSQNAGWDDVKSGYNWFIDYYLDEMKKAGEIEGKRLLDVLDVHLYSEATDNENFMTNEAGSNRVVMSGTDESTDAMRKARIHSTRSFWDKNYVENSWIGKWITHKIPFIQTLQASIDTYYPGTKLGITEYNFGAYNDVSGGIAQADFLGLLGKYGVYQASYWELTKQDSNEDYITSAFQIFRDYDGEGSSFGDKYVVTTNSDSVNASAYAAISGTETGKVNVVLINKDMSKDQEFTITLKSDETYVEANAFTFDATSRELKKEGISHNIKGDKLTFTAPSMSVTNIEILSDQISAIADAEVVTEFEMSSYPNPFNPVTTIAYSIPSNEIGSITVYNVKGDVISKYSALSKIGAISFGKPSLASGVYFARLVTGSRVKTMKMIMIK